MPSIDTAQRRKRVRTTASAQIIRLQLKGGMGNSRWVNADLLETSQSGVRISLFAPLAMGSKVVIWGKFNENRSDMKSAATVMWCAGQISGSFHAGLKLTDGDIANRTKNNTARNQVTLCENRALSRPISEVSHETRERSFPCKCGRGKIVAEWEEHDTWPSSNQSITWHFECDECSDRYTFYDDLGTSLVRKSDAARDRLLIAAYKAANLNVYEAAKRYEQQWIDYISDLRIKLEMRRVLGFNSSFLIYTKSSGWLEREAKEVFSYRPKKCLTKMGISDATVDELDAKARNTEREREVFWAKVKKMDVTFR
jgi:hypothetical protein